MGWRSWLFIGIVAGAGVLTLFVGWLIPFVITILGLFGLTLLVAGVLAALRFRADWTADIDPTTGQRLYPTEISRGGAGRP
jgi:hypothetical protein